MSGIPKFTVEQIAAALRESAGVLRPDRPGVRIDAPGSFDHGSHVGRELEDKPHGRPLQRGCEGRTRGRRQVFVGNESGNDQAKDLPG